MNAEPRPGEREQADADFVSLWTVGGLCVVAAVWLVTLHFAPIDKDAFDRARGVSRAQDADVVLRCRMTFAEAARRGVKNSPNERCPPDSPPPDPQW